MHGHLVQFFLGMKVGLAAPRFVHLRVAGDAEHPGQERGVRLEGRSVFQDSEEDILGEVLAVLASPREAQEEGEEPKVVTLEEKRQLVDLSIPHPRHDPRVVLSVIPVIHRAHTASFPMNTGPRPNGYTGMGMRGVCSALSTRQLGWPCAPFKEGFKIHPWNHDNRAFGEKPDV
jgi:hypothetical protein